jgi:hypothetical protein
LCTRRGGSQRYVDAHVQFRSGTSLEQAHRTAHQLTDAIAAALGGADVLIHLEPADRVRPGETLVKLSDPAQASARVAASASSMDAVERGTGGMGPGA